MSIFHFGLCFRYEGEWFANKKYGYGVTTFRDGSREEGKYKNNVLITSQKKKHLFLIRSAKFRERIDAAVDSAGRASKYAMQKADIAISRTATARGKAELADVSADHAKVDSEIAIQTAREFAPDFKPSLLERFERIRVRERFRNTLNEEPPGNKMKLNENQITATSNIMSPNKAAQALNSSHQQLQQHTQAPQPQSLLNPQLPNRRTSVNPIMRQSSIDYTTQNNTTFADAPSQNPLDYNNFLGHNQQIGQLQLTGNSAFNTPQKFTQTKSLQQQNYNQPAQSVSVQQSQHNQMYQNNVNQYQPMNNHQLENFSSYANYQQQGGQKFQQNYSDQQASNYGNNETQGRRNSRQVSDSGRQMLSAIHQASIDHFDHYKRPPSRDSSVDRYSRAASRLSGVSRQPSVDRQGINSLGSTTINPEILFDHSVRAGSQIRGTTPAPNLNGSVLTGVINSSGVVSRRGSRSETPVFQQQPSIQTIQAQYSSPNQPFEDVLLRQRTLGQDIIPSPGQPKRTESLFIPTKPAPSLGGSGGSKGISKVC